MTFIVIKDGNIIGRIYADCYETAKTRAEEKYGYEIKIEEK